MLPCPTLHRHGTLLESGPWTRSSACPRSAGMPPTLAAERLCSMTSGSRPGIRSYLAFLSVTAVAQPRLLVTCGGQNSAYCIRGPAATYASPELRILPHSLGSGSQITGDLSRVPGSCGRHRPPSSKLVSVLTHRQPSFSWSAIHLTRTHLIAEARSTRASALTCPELLDTGAGTPGTMSSSQCSRLLSPRTDQRALREQAQSRSLHRDIPRSMENYRAAFGTRGDN